MFLIANLHFTPLTEVVPYTNIVREMVGEEFPYFAKRGLSILIGVPIIAAVTIARVVSL